MTLLALATYTGLGHHISSAAIAVPQGWELAGITFSAWPCRSFKDHTASGAATAEVFCCFSLLPQKRQLGHIGRTFSSRTPGLQIYAGRGWLTKISLTHFYETKEDHPNNYSIILRVLSEETRILLHRLQIRDHGFNCTAVLNRILSFSAEAFRSLTSCTLGIWPTSVKGIIPLQDYNLHSLPLR